MMLRNKRRSCAMVAGVAAVAMSLTACGGDSGSDDGTVTLSFLVDNSDASLNAAQGLADAFHAENPDITVEVETRPGGSDGDNIVKTRLSTGEMTDVFLYNSGSLFQALNPQDTMVPVTDEDFVGDLDPAFVQTVSAGDDVYGAPFGSFMGGGILYNIPVYEQLGLEIPKTWAEFEANNEQVKAAGIAPVIQTYQETWTSQLLVLGDFHNVMMEEPDFAEEYTAGDAKFADTPAALRGFQHLQEGYERGWWNEDFASATNADGMRMIATGEGAHYPMLTFAIASVAQNNPEQLNDVGLFAIPGQEADDYGLTVWSPAGVYIPATTEGDKLEAAKKFLAFVGSPAGCDAQTEATPPSGPYGVTSCELPDDVPQVVKDLQGLIDQGNSTPALEFLSPVKGPSLEQICVAVGSGITSAEDGAAQYDEDAKKQAQQLGLDGW